MKKRNVIGILTGLMLLPAAARADDATPPPPNPPAAVTPTPPSPPIGAATAPLVWKWQRFRAWEYPVTAAALGGAITLYLAAPAPSANWTGGILFDDWVQDRTGINSITARQSVKSMTDVFFYGSMAYRLLDSALVPSLVWRSPDVAFQMSMIDLESFSVVALTLWGSQALFGRERPFARRCGDPAFAATDACAANAPEHNRSFYAGHPTVVLTAAGLTCMHHAHLPLYGGGLPDTLACGLMISAALVTGAGRVMTEEHHATDLIVGYSVGVVAGFLMPEFLHYRRKKELLVDPPRPQDATLVRATVVPQIGPDQIGIGVRGVF